MLGTALVSIRGCLNQLGDVYKHFAANETKMYLQILLLVAGLATGVIANLLTVQAKTQELDPDSIGSTERYYKTWVKPVYVWCAHYALIILFNCSVMYTLYEAGCEVKGQTE